VTWKAIHDEQAIRYEIAMFKTWLSSQSPSIQCNFRDLRLTKINEVLTQLVFDRQQTTTTKPIELPDSSDTLTLDLNIQTLSILEQMAQSYAQKVLDETSKLTKQRDKYKNITDLNKISIAIATRSNNIIHRAQYNLQQQLNIAFNGTTFNNKKT
jgi:hypothetical protein